MPTIIDYTLIVPVDLTGSAVGTSSTTASLTDLMRLTGSLVGSSSAGLGDSGFLGADFKIQSLVQRSATVLRLRFTNDPLVVSSLNANDALNVSQYALSGPVGARVALVTPVPGDPQSIDLTLAAPLTAGTWTLTVSSSLGTAEGRNLQDPRVASLVIAGRPAQEAVSGGATNDDAEAVLRKHLNPAFKGKGWSALIAALAVGDQMNWDNAKAAFDQLFKTSASGVYLDRKCADDGLKRPSNIGMSDDLFRQLGIKVTNDKLTEEVLLEVLEVFYGSESLRGHIESTVGPFQLTDGDDLNVNLDGVDLPAIIFREADFANITQATALEVAAAITRQLRLFGSTGFATSYVDPAIGQATVRIFSGALGLISSVQVTGGLAQKALLFEQQVLTPPAGTNPSTLSWNLTIPEAGTLRLMISGASALDMNQLQVGDYALITGAAFDPANRGSFAIQNIDIRYVGSTYTQSFDVLNDSAVAQTTVPQASLSDVLFFRPVRKAIHQGGTRSVVVAQPDDGQTSIVLPATTQAVNREVGTAAYVLDNNSISATLARNGTTVTATTSSPHGLSVGQQVKVTQALSTQRPAIHAGDGTGLTDASLGTIWSVVAPPPHAANYATLTKLTNGIALLVGGEDGTPTQSASCSKFMVTSSTIDTTTGGVHHSYAWQVTGSMTLARAHHTASLLGDGSVFVAGGQTGGTTVTATTERWTSDVWTNGPALSTARRNHQAQVLNNGNVLIFGGDPGPNTSPLSSTEIYNGTTISAGPSLVTARSNFTSVKLANGNVLAIGGNNISYSSAGGVSRTQITAGVSQTDATPAPVARYVTDYNNQVAQDYLFLSATTSVLVHHDGSTETVTPPAVGSGGTWNLTASVGCRVNDSKALVITIYSDLAGAWTFHAWYFDWTTKIFTAATNPSTTLPDLGSDLPIPCLMADGRILWIWGPYNGTTHVTPCFIFDPAGAAGSGTWSATGDYPGPFAAPHSLTLLNDGRILSTGNGTNSFTFDSGTGTWTAHSWGTNTVYLNTYSDLQYAQIKLHDGRVFVAVSGENATIFDPTTNTWADQPSGTNTTYNGVWAVEYAPNKVFVAEAVGGIYYYDLDTTTWTEGTSDFVRPDVAGWLDVGKWAVINVRGVSPEIDVYTFSSGSSIALPPLASCEIYDGASWTLTGSMTYGRANARAIVLDDGRVLVTGGTGKVATQPGSAVDLSVAEVYDPATGRWAPANRTGVARSNHGIIESNGLVVIVGDDTAPEYYDPAKGSWKKTPSSIAAGTGTVEAVQLKTGLVLAVSQNAANALIQANDSWTAGGLNGIFRVTSATPTTFTYETPNMSAYSSCAATICALAAPASPNGLNGPFILDSDSSVAITAISSTTSQDLFAGQRYSLLTLADASSFPDEEGYIVIGFGTKNATSPIRYLSRVSATQLLLDYQQKMPTTNLTGATATLLSGKSGLSSITDAKSAGLFYATDSGAGRQAAEEQIQNIVAAGIELDLEVVYPGDKGLGKNSNAWVWDGEENT
jgi:hypothetical protein